MWTSETTHIKNCRRIIFLLRRVLWLHGGTFLCAWSRREMENRFLNIFLSLQEWEMRGKRHFSIPQFKAFRQERAKIFSHPENVSVLITLIRSPSRANFDVHFVIYRKIGAERIPRWWTVIVEIFQSIIHQIFLLVQESGVNYDGQLAIIESFTVSWNCISSARRPFLRSGSQRMLLSTNVGHDFLSGSHRKLFYISGW